MCVQVLVSIQSMIFVDDTYFNEPGFDRVRNTPEGKTAAAAYSKEAAIDTLKHAILRALQKPTLAFADITRCASCLSCRAMQRYPHTALVNPQQADLVSPRRPHLGVCQRASSMAGFSTSC